jgi:monovalent cation/hydrogen antiporter
MSHAEAIIFFLSGIMVFTIISNRFNLPAPIVLMIAGMGMSLVPNLHGFHLHPDLIFLVFLPPLIYLSAWSNSWKSLADNALTMFGLSFGLVVFTAVTVGAIAHALIPGIDWPVALVLGAVISPTDALAATSVIKKMELPESITTILEGEGLLNDVTALVMYKLLIAIVLTGTYSVSQVPLHFAWAAVGGCAIGYGLGRIVELVRLKITDASLQVAISLLTPYIAYTLGEVAEASGVIAVVVTGLYMGWKSPWLLTSATRVQTLSVWTSVVFLANGMLFLLTGLQLPFILQELSAYSPLSLLIYAIAINVAVIAVRFLWVFGFEYIPKFLIPSLRAREPYPNWRHVVIIAWSGMRSVLSLAAALAIPMILPNGRGFPHRDLITFLTFTVIFCTLVIQGALLPALIKALKVKSEVDTGPELFARRRAAIAALARIEELQTQDQFLLDEESVEHLRFHYQLQIEHYHPDTTPELNPDTLRKHMDRKTLALELLKAQRTEVIALREQGRINDELLRKLLTQFDYEEMNLTAHVII